MRPSACSPAMTWEFAVLPVTTAANMVAAGIDLVLLGVHEWKAFYLIASTGHQWNGWSSLSGKTIYTPEGKGQTVDVLTRYALTEANIAPDRDVTFVYAPAQEIVALFKEGKVDFAALPEPFVTLALASGKGLVVLDYQDEWSRVSRAQHGIPIAGLFVKRGFWVDHPTETREIVRLVSESTQWANDNPAAAIQASSQALPLPSVVMEKALQRLKFEFVAAAAVEGEVSDFLVRMQATYPEGIKALPDDRFFARW